MAQEQQKVFRPRSPQESAIIDHLMELHVVKGHIREASWTQYVAYLINKDIQETLNPR